MAGKWKVLATVAGLRRGDGGLTASSGEPYEPPHEQARMADGRGTMSALPTMSVGDGEGISRLQDPHFGALQGVLLRGGNQ